MQQLMRTKLSRVDWKQPTAHRDATERPTPRPARRRAGSPLIRDSQEPVRQRLLGNDLARSRKALLLDLSYLFEPKLGPGCDNTQEFVSWTAWEGQSVQLFPNADALGRGVYDRNLACQRIRPTLLHFRVLACESRTMIRDRFANP